MPVYVYKCNECGKKQEIFHKTYKEENVIKCLNCNSNDLKKTFAAPMINTSGSMEMPDMPSCATGNCQSGMCGL